MKWVSLNYALALRISLMCNGLNPSSKGRREPAFGNVVSLKRSTSSSVLASYCVLLTFNRVMQLLLLYDIILPFIMKII